MLQKMIDLMVENSKLNSAKEYNLGMLINDLEKCDKPKYKIRIEGTNVYPNYFHSWRGSYCELALEPTTEPITIEELLVQAKEADGKTYTGWKGGEFTMDKFTPIHIAEMGHSFFGDERAKVIGIKKVNKHYEIIIRNDEGE